MTNVQKFSAPFFTTNQAAARFSSRGRLRFGEKRCPAFSRLRHVAPRRATSLPYIEGL